MPVKECPQCGNDGLRKVLATGRKIQQRCSECGWKGEPEIPETIPINPFKTITVGQFYGYHYEIFDKYGQIMLSSRYYNQVTKAEEELRKDLKTYNKSPDSGPCTAILWPNKVTVEGKVFK